MKNPAALASVLIGSALLVGALALNGCKNSASNKDPGATTASAGVAAGGGEKIAVPGGGQPATDGTKGGGGVPEGANSRGTGSDSSYQTAFEVPAGTVGTAASVLIKATPGSGYHVNKEFPASLKLEPIDGITFSKAALEKEDAAKMDDNNLIFDIKVTAAKPGNYTLKGMLKFAVCTTSTCDPKRVPVEIAFAAK